jgi:hypothetical protein
MPSVSLANCSSSSVCLLKTGLWIYGCLHRKFEEAMRAQPNRIYLHLVVLKLERICYLVESNEHVLNNMHFMIIVSDSFTLSGLKKRDLRWHEPSHRPSEPPLISKRQDEFPLPIETPSVSVVVLSSGNVLSKLTSLKSSLGVLVEPGLEPPSNTVDNIALFLRFFLGGISPCHVHGFCGAINHALHKVWDLGLISKCVIIFSITPNTFVTAI